MQWYSERTTRTLSLAAGDTTAYSAAVDMRRYAGGALLLPAGFSGTVQIQASPDASTWNFCRDTDGLLISLADTLAGDWVALDASIFPHGYIRLALTDGNSTPTPGGTSYDFELALKS